MREVNKCADCVHYEPIDDTEGVCKYHTHGSSTVYTRAEERFELCFERKEK